MDSVSLTLVVAPMPLTSRSFDAGEPRATSTSSQALRWLELDLCSASSRSMTVAAPLAVPPGKVRHASRQEAEQRTTMLFFAGVTLVGILLMLGIGFC